MTYSVHVTLQAERDMDNAADYIAFTLLNPSAAYNLLVYAKETLNSLELNPERNRIVDDPLLFSWGIRLMIIKNYLAFYVIDEKNKTVHIIRLLYKKRNWLHILKQGFSLE